MEKNEPRVEAPQSYTCRVALTGHRRERLRGKEKEVFDWITNMIKILGEGYDEIVCYCGCAEGADELFGHAAVQLPNTSLVLCKPVYGYRNKEIKELDIQADASISMSYNWTPFSDELRDKYMVDHCDILLAVWDGIESGGVWSTIKYAMRIKRPIIFLPKEILLNEN